MEKKTALAFGLIVLVIILLPYYYKAITPQREPVPSSSESTETITPDSAEIEIQISKESVPTEEEFIDTGVSLTEETAGFPPEANQQYAVVETPLYKLILSSRGGVLVSAELNKYKGVGGTPVQLVREGSEDNLNLTIFRNGVLLDMRDLRFNPNTKELFIPGDSEGTLILRAEDAQGAWVQKKFTFYGDRYDFDLALGAGGMDDLDPYYEISWGSGMAITEADSAQDIYYAEAYAYINGEMDTFKGKGKREISGQASGQTEWIAQRNKYFEVAILPKSEAGTGVRFGIEAQPQIGKHRPKVFRMTYKWAVNWMQ